MGTSRACQRSGGHCWYAVRGILVLVVLLTSPRPLIAPREGSVCGSRTRSRLPVSWPRHPRRTSRYDHATILTSVYCSERRLWKAAAAGRGDRGKALNARARHQFVSNSYCDVPRLLRSSLPVSKQIIYRMKRLTRVWLQCVFPTVKLYRHKLPAVRYDTVYMWFLLQFTLPPCVYPCLWCSKVPACFYHHSIICSVLSPQWAKPPQPEGFLAAGGRVGRCRRPAKIADRTRPPRARGYPRKVDTTAVCRPVMMITTFVYMNSKQWKEMMLAGCLHWLCETI